MTTKSKKGGDAKDDNQKEKWEKEHGMKKKKGF